MLRFNRCRSLLPVLLLIFLFPFTGIARKPVLEHAIGDTITADEAAHYSLFQDIPDFHAAVLSDSISTKNKILRVYSEDIFSRSGTTCVIDNSVFQVLPAVLARTDSLLAGFDDVSDGISVEITPRHGPKVYGKSPLGPGLRFRSSLSSATAKSRLT